MEALVSHDRAARLQDNANIIWGAAERMRGKITPADYGKVILPFTVLRRMDCLLEPHIKTIQTLATSWRRLPTKHALKSSAARSGWPSTA